MKIEVLKSGPYGQPGDLCELPAKVAYVAIGRGEVKFHVPRYEPKPGRPTCIRQHHKLILLANIDGLGKRGEVVQLDPVQCNELIESGMAMPQRLLRQGATLPPAREPKKEVPNVQ